MSYSVEVLTDSELNELLRVVQGDVAALEESGYTLIGGVRYTTRGFEAAAVLMVGPAKDGVSTVARTPFGPVIAIGSGSETGRRVVSRNGSFWQLPPWELCNDVPVAEPPRLDEAHSAAPTKLRDVFEPRIRDEMRIENMSAELAEYLKKIESSGEPTAQRAVLARLVTTHARSGGSRNGSQVRRDVGAEAAHNN